MNAYTKVHSQQKLHIYVRMCAQMYVVHVYVRVFACMLVYTYLCTYV